MFETLLHDLRYAARMLRKSPTFTAIAILVIAVGSGAVTTIFSAASALVLRPVPGAVDPSRLVDISRVDPRDPRGSMTPSYPYYTHIRDEAKTMSGIAAWAPIALTISTGAQGTAVFANIVSANYFSVFGVKPSHGRFFTTDEDRTPGAHPVVVLSDAFWQRRFAGDPSIVGRSVLVNGAAYTVVGIAPPKFTGEYPVIRTDAWVPLMQVAQLGHDGDGLTNAGSGWLQVFGRVRDGATMAQAKSELSRITTNHLAEEPRDFAQITGIAMSRMTGFPADASGAVTGFVALLLLISALVLVIASVNVAGMLLARATARRREMAVRIALGAGRIRLVRQLLTESVLLSLAGAAGGILIAVFATRLFGQIPLPAEVPLSADLSPDYRVLCFALGVALVTGIVFGVAPALEATRNDPSSALRSDTAGSGRRSGLRNALVIGQVAISLLLLTSAGLFVRALARGHQIPAGFDIAHVATTPIDVSTSGYSEPRARILYESLRQRLLRAPGVVAVSYGRWLPLSNSSAGTRITVAGTNTPKNPDGTTDVNFGVVGPDYFTVLQVPLMQGREFRTSDDNGAPRVAVVNETFAKTFWPGINPIGRTFTYDSSSVTVIGVSRDSKYTSLNEPLRPFLYFPMAQDWNSGSNLLIRTSGDPATLTPLIRDAVRDADPLLPAPAVVTMSVATSIGLLPQRVAAAVTGVMGALGLLLAIVGLYGVVAHAVGQRTREIGVRMALGADRSDVLHLIVRDGMRLVVIGVIIGMLLAAGATRVMAKFLFGVSPLDPIVFAVIPVGFALATLLASYLPARKAAATNPVDALRA